MSESFMYFKQNTIHKQIPSILKLENKRNDDAENNIVNPNTKLR